MGRSDLICSARTRETHGRGHRERRPSERPAFWRAFCLFFLDQTITAKSWTPSRPFPHRLSHLISLPTPHTRALIPSRSRPAAPHTSPPPAPGRVVATALPRRDGPRVCNGSWALGTHHSSANATQTGQRDNTNSDAQQTEQRPARAPALTADHTDRRRQQRPAAPASEGRLAPRLALSSASVSADTLLFKTATTTTTSEKAVARWTKTTTTCTLRSSLSLRTMTKTLIVVSSQTASPKCPLLHPLRLRLHPLHPRHPHLRHHPLRRVTLQLRPTSQIPLSLTAENKLTICRFRFQTGAATARGPFKKRPQITRKTPRSLPPCPPSPPYRPLPLPLPPHSVVVLRVVLHEIVTSLRSKMSSSQHDGLRLSGQSSSARRLCSTFSKSLTLSSPQTGQHALPSSFFLLSSSRSLWQNINSFTPSLSIRHLVIPLCDATRCDAM